MSYSFVFVRSIVLTVIVGLFLLTLGRSARQRSFIAGFWGVALGIHLLWWGLPHVHSVWGAIGRWLVSAWIAALLTAVVLIVPFALYRIVRRLLGRRSSPFTRVPLVFLGLSLAVGMAVSLNNLGDPVVREEVVDIAGLPEGLDGLRIANVGDVHIGRFIVPQDLARAVDIVNERNVDLMVVTGDLIDDLRQLEPTLDALERSQALPILSILGNHDKYPDEEAVVAALRRRNPRIQLLVNEGLTVSPRGTPLRVVGVDYAMAPHGGHMLPRAEQDAAMRGFAEQAFAGSPPGETIVALSHHPEFFPIAARNGAALTLASHTHGGQVSFFGRPLIVAYDYMQGLYREGSAYLDVSAGVGHWLPVRIGVPREIAVITLRRQRVEAARVTQDLPEASYINVCALMHAKPGQGISPSECLDGAGEADTRRAGFHDL